MKQLTETSNEHFEKDLERGRKKEKESGEYFQNQLGGELQLAPDKYFPDWDFQLRIAFEIKYDYMAEKTGNIAFEYASNGQPSGVKLSRAHYWGVFYSGDYYIFPLETLKRHLKENQSKYKKMQGGDNQASSMLLVPVDTVLSWGFCKKIEDLGSLLN